MGTENPIEELLGMSTKIVEIGGKLSELRAARDALNTQIQALEKELLPLATKHSTLMATLLGQALPTLTVQPVVPSPEVPTSPPRGVATSLSATTKTRILDFLKRMDTSDGAVSAMEIADALKIDAAAVRECLLELRNAR
jgi:biotin operon repressor